MCGPAGPKPVAPEPTPCLPSLREVQGQHSEHVMKVRSGFIESIGNTPLIKLLAASEATGCEIYGKAEFLNPGGSVKDRAALAIIEDAEKHGKLKPGGVIVEGTAGNTGIGLCVV